jgi:hypothetical protein
MKRNTTLNYRFLIIIYLYHKEIYSFFNKKTRDNDMTSYVMCRPLWFIQDLIIIILDINWRLFKIRSTNEWEKTLTWLLPPSLPPSSTVRRMLRAALHYSLQLIAVPSFHSFAASSQDSILFFIHNY